MSATAAKEIYRDDWEIIRVALECVESSDPNFEKAVETLYAKLQEARLIL